MESLPISFRRSSPGRRFLSSTFDARPELHPGQRDLAPFVLHLGKDAFLLSLLGGFFLPASGLRAVPFSSQRKICLFREQETSLVEASRHQKQVRQVQGEDFARVSTGIEPVVFVPACLSKANISLSVERTSVELLVKIV